MSTSNTHQQSLADVGSKTRPLMLERGSYISWARILEGDDLKHYEAKIEAMNLILISIPNDINNSVDACTTTQAMWQRVERLMRGTVQNKVDRETRFNNEFDQFIAEPGEALVLVYNRFAQLMNDQERNGIKFLPVTVNTKLTEDTYDDLFDYLHQYEKLVNASRAKKLENSHDLLALVGCIPKQFLRTSVMMILARAITQRYSNPTNNRLRTSSNTINQEIVQTDIVNIQSRNSGNDGRNTRRSYVQDEIIEGNNVQNDTGEKGHYSRNYPKPKVRDSKYFMEQMLLAKQDEAGVNLTDEHNEFLVADATRMEEIEE
ncbi:hypothetical protein Tco_0970587 [Tanacetum coccineum]